MYGAIIGDIVGSKYEFNGIKTKEFPLFSNGCNYTDDTVMTLAVASALMISREKKCDFQTVLVAEMRRFGRQYPCPMGGYGGNFAMWLNSEDPQPYNSFGNGSAMRVSPCGYIAVELTEALSLAKASAEVTHNHLEGIKGAQAVAGAIFLAKAGAPKEDIRRFVEVNFYDLNKTLDEIRPTYRFNETCQETVPQAIEAFLESESFEDAIRNAISLGGDSDTLAAITGSIAWAFYVRYWETEDMEHWHGAERDIYDKMMIYLPDDLQKVAVDFIHNCVGRMGTYGRTGFYSIIPHTDDKHAFWEYKLMPETISIDSGKPLKDKMKTTFKPDIAKRFALGESYVKILNDLKIGVVNYLEYQQLFDRMDKNPEMIYQATLEECLMYLTVCWRLDYASGGGSQFRDGRTGIRNARMRIVDLLFEERI